MTAYTSNSESTSTGLQFKAAYVTLMLHQGAPGNLFFEGANVSEFLDRFENMYDEYRMSTSEKICNLPWYCKMFTARHIRSVIGFSELDWVKIYPNFKKKYEDWDIAQQISSRASLEVFKNKLRTENTEVF